MKYLRSTCLIAFLSSLWLLVTPLQSQAHSHVTAIAAIKEQPNQPLEQLFDSTQKKLARLLISTPHQDNSTSWEQIAAQFGELFQKTPETELGQESLYLQARTYQLMAVRFKSESYRRQAEAKFLQLVHLYPHHQRSDDAQHQADLLSQKKGVSRSEQVFSSKNAPQVSTKNQSKQVLSQPAVTADEDQSLSQRVPKAPPPLAHITKTSFWISDNYARVVISAEPQLDYQVKQTDESITIHLTPSALASGVKQVQKFSKGLLHQVQIEDTHRGEVVFQLGLNAYKEYKTFTLHNPFRLVVDLYGQEKSLKDDSNMTLPKKESNVQAEKTVAENDLDQAIIPLLADMKKYGPTGPHPHIKLQQEPLSLTQQLGLGIKTIVIDPGHGGKDPGAMAHGLKEKDIVLQIAQKLATILREDFHYQVLLTRTEDVYIPLEQRIEIANHQKADLFVSIHINAHTDQSNSGIETYFLNLATDADAMRVAALENASSTHSFGELQDILASLMNNSKIDESSRLARFVQNNLIKGFSHTYRPKNLGVKQAPFYVLIGAEMPAILAELTFISNPSEARLLKNSAHLQRLARQLANGIVAYVDHHQAAVRLY